MKSRSFHVLIAMILLIALGAWRFADAQEPAVSGADVRPFPAVDDIVSLLVENNLARARALGSYEGTRVYRLDYRGFPGSKSAEMTVDVKYQSPATKEFSIRSQSGSKLILDKVFRRMLQSEKMRSHRRTSLGSR